MKQVAFVIFCCAWALGCSSGGAKSPVPPDLTPLQASSGGGGLALTCAPKDGDSITGGDFPGCTFVEQSACKADTDCGCGCSCDCGVCNCDAAAAPGACEKPEDCGPSCLGLTCQGGSCVAAKANDWTGVYQGTFSWPTTVAGGTCDAGTGAIAATGMADGRFSVQVIATDEEIEVLLLSQQGTTVCSLPFVVSGTTATLVPGSACVTSALASQCPTASVSAAPPVAIQTFLGGSATLSGDSLTLSASDVFIAPSESGPECDSVPKGALQVNHESLTATLTRCAASGCPEPVN